MKRANAEGWHTLRKEADSKSTAEAQQKASKAAADNAAIAANLKKRLLQRLQNIEKSYPFDATEVRSRKGNSVVVFRIRDLTAAYKDLTEDLPKAEENKNAPIYELLRKLDGECDV